MSVRNDEGGVIKDYYIVSQDERERVEKKCCHQANWEVLKYKTG